jgi:hypothetical protein
LKKKRALDDIESTSARLIQEPPTRYLRIAATTAVREVPAVAEVAAEAGVAASGTTGTAAVAVAAVAVPEVMLLPTTLPRPRPI